MSANVTPPIVVDLGDTNEEHLRQLPGGTGQLVDEIEEVMRLVRRADADSGNRVFVPIVAVYTPTQGDWAADSRAAGAIWVRDR